MKKALLFCVAITIIELIIAAFLFASLPEQIPMHWNMAGELDGWGSRWAVFLIPTMTFLPLLLLAGILSLALRKNERAKGLQKFCNIALVLEKLVFTVLFVMHMASVVERDLKITSMDRITFGVLGLILIVLGNYMPKIRQNEVVGVRTPYTLKNSVVWQKSNHFGGVLFVLAGIFFILVQFLLPSSFNIWIPIIFLCICVIVVWIYSWWWFKKEMKNLE